MKIRQYSIILLFLAACMGLSFASYLGHFNEFGSDQTPTKGPRNDAVDETFFKDVNYYSVEKSRPFIELESNELSVSTIDGVVIAFDPIGIIYRYEKESDLALEPIHFQSKKSRALLKKKEIFLENDVEIQMSTTNLKADKISILSAGEILYAYNNVKTLSTIEKTSDDILVNSSNATYRPKLQLIEYSGAVNGSIKRKRIYEENISFKTDLLTLNLPLSLVEMKGNVSFKKENLDAFANRGEVFLENYNKKLKYYALYDDVRLQEKLVSNGRPFQRKAFAEKLEGLISEKKIILTGLPKVFQERDVIKGNRIIIRENIETVEVDDANTNITLEKEKEKD
ncbi:MAG: LptA/OstA family protein [Bacteriovorax sp.]|nr:LptA/OstA family protein [Bacteriovorax sp.]